MENVLGSNGAGLVGGFVALGVGFTVLHFLRRGFDVKDGTTFAVFAFLFFVGFAVLSGKISEITGPGDISIKLQKVTQAKVRVETPIEFEAGAFQREDKDQGKLEEHKKELKSDKPNNVLLLVGRALHKRPDGDQEAPYTENLISNYIREFSEVGTSTSVVMLDYTSKVFIASASPQAVRDVLGSEERDKFLKALNYGESDLLNFDFLIRESLFEKDTKNRALELFKKTKAQTLMVLKEDRTLAGVVERAAFLEQLTIALAKAAK